MTFIKSEGKEVEEKIFILDNLFFVVLIYKEEME